MGKIHNWTIGLLLAVAVVCRAQVTFTLYSAPTVGAPEFITGGPDGNVWYTDQSGKIGRITPAGVITEFKVGGGVLVGITTGPDGNLWFTDEGGEIGRITPAGAITEFPVGGAPQSITAGPDRNLWFTEASGNKIGRITPTGVITEFPVGNLPSPITAGPDGNLWFTEEVGNKIGRITPAGVVTEFPIPTASSFPVGIAAGPDGNLWFTEEVGNKIGRITPTGVITEFPVPTLGSVVGVITAGPDGNLWFLETIGIIGRITTAGVITEFFIPNATRPQGITAGPDGNLWFTELLANMIGRIQLQSGCTSSQLAISSLSPNHGGNTGQVTPQIYGCGFALGAQVRLTGLRGDIVGTNTTVSNGSVITTTFDLTGETPGARTVLITNPDNTSVTLPNGFTVEPGGVPEISVQIVGRDKIRFAAEQTYYLAVVNTGSIDSPPGIAFLEVPSTLGFQQMNGTDLFVAGNTSAPEFGVPTPGSPSSTGSMIASAATASAASKNQVLTFASAGVPAGGSQIAPVSLTLPLGATSQFTVTAAWQSSLTNLPFDQYLAAIGAPYIPFQAACSQCDAQAVSEVTAITDAQSAYTAWQITSQDLSSEHNNLCVSVGSILAQGGLVAALGLSAPEALALGAVIASGTFFVTHFLDPASDKDANLTNFVNSIGRAAIDFRADPFLKANPVVAKLLTVFDAFIAGVQGVGSIDQASGAEGAAWGTFQQKLVQYLLARSNYQSCLSQSCGTPPPPPPPPPLPGTTTLPVTGVSSLDPNDKEGPVGSQPQRYVSDSTGSVYLISFENQASATAPAQRVVITDLVDPANFELSTAALGPIAFSGQVLDPPALPLMAIGTFSTFADLRPSVNLLVHVTALFDSTTGVLKWTLQSIDPTTGQPPTDPVAGFLPPGSGGSVSLIVRGKNSLVTGTVVSNGATIIFDSNPSIPTPVWSNTIDNTPPTSRVSTLPAQSYPSFLVQWSGSDVGSGIQDFTIYVSDNGNSFVPWLPNVALSSGMFLGQPGHTYAFYSIARDLVGNIESAKAIGETSTRIVADTTPPVITPNVSGTLGNAGWYRSNVTIFWSVADPESGIASSNGCLGITLTADTAGVTITCSATNGVGLSASVSVTFKIDKTPPVISGMPAPGCTIWPPNHKLVQVATVTAADALSGLAPGSFKLTGTSSDPANGQIVITGGPSQFNVQLGADKDETYTLTATASDLAGNIANQQATCSVPHDQGK